MQCDEYKGGGLFDFISEHQYCLYVDAVTGITTSDSSLSADVQQYLTRDTHAPATGDEQLAKACAPHSTLYHTKISNRIKDCA